MADVLALAAAGLAGFVLAVAVLAVFLRMLVRDGSLAVKPRGGDRG